MSYIEYLYALHRVFSCLSSCIFMSYIASFVPYIVSFRSLDRVDLWITSFFTMFLRVLHHAIHYVLYHVFSCLTSCFFRSYTVSFCVLHRVLHVFHCVLHPVFSCLTSCIFVSYIVYILTCYSSHNLYSAGEKGNFLHSEPKLSDFRHDEVFPKNNEILRDMFA